MNLNNTKFPVTHQQDNIPINLNDINQQVYLLNSSKYKQPQPSTYVQETPNFQYITPNIVYTKDPQPYSLIPVNNTAIAYTQIPILNDQQRINNHYIVKVPQENNNVNYQNTSNHNIVKAPQISQYQNANYQPTSNNYSSIQSNGNYTSPAYSDNQRPSVLINNKESEEPKIETLSKSKYNDSSNISGLLGGSLLPNQKENKNSETNKQSITKLGTFTTYYDRTSLSPENKNNKKAQMNTSANKYITSTKNSSVNINKMYNRNADILKSSGLNKTDTLNNTDSINYKLKNLNNTIININNNNKKNSLNNTNTNNNSNYLDSKSEISDYIKQTAFGTTYYSKLNSSSKNKTHNYSSLLKKKKLDYSNIYKTNDSFKENNNNKSLKSTSKEIKDNSKDYVLSHQSISISINKNKNHSNEEDCDDKDTNRISARKIRFQMNDLKIEDVVDNEVNYIHYQTEGNLTNYHYERKKMEKTNINNSSKGIHRVNSESKDNLLSPEQTNNISIINKNSCLNTNTFTNDDYISTSKKNENNPLNNNDINNIRIIKKEELATPIRFSLGNKQNPDYNDNESHRQNYDYERPTSFGNNAFNKGNNDIENNDHNDINNYNKTGSSALDIPFSSNPFQKQTDNSTINNRDDYLNIESSNNLKEIVQQINPNLSMTQENQFNSPLSLYNKNFIQESKDKSNNGVYMKRKTKPLNSIKSTSNINTSNMNNKTTLQLDNTNIKPTDKENISCITICSNDPINMLSKNSSKKVIFESNSNNNYDSTVKNDNYNKNKENENDFKTTLTKTREDLNICRNKINEYNNNKAAVASNSYTTSNNVNETNLKTNISTFTKNHYHNKIKRTNKDKIEGSKELEELKNYSHYMEEKYGKNYENDYLKSINKDNYKISSNNLSQGKDYLNNSIDSTVNINNNVNRIVKKPHSRNISNTQDYINKFNVNNIDDGNQVLNINNINNSGKSSISKYSIEKNKYFNKTFTNQFNNNIKDKNDGLYKYSSLLTNDIQPHRKQSHTINKINRLNNNSIDNNTSYYYGHNQTMTNIFPIKNVNNRVNYSSINENTQDNKYYDNRNNLKLKIDIHNDLLNKTMSNILTSKSKNSFYQNPNNNSTINNNISLIKKAYSPYKLTTANQGKNLNLNNSSNNNPYLNNLYAKAKNSNNNYSNIGRNYTYTSSDYNIQNNLNHRYKNPFSSNNNNTNKNTNTNINSSEAYTKSTRRNNNDNNREKELNESSYHYNYCNTDPYNHNSNNQSNSRSKNVNISIPRNNAYNYNNNAANSHIPDPLSPINNKLKENLIQTYNHNSNSISKSKYSNKTSSQNYNSQINPNTSISIPTTKLTKHNFINIQDANSYSHTLISKETNNNSNNENALNQDHKKSQDNTHTHCNNSNKNSINKPYNTTNTNTTSQANILPTDRTSTAEIYKITFIERRLENLEKVSFFYEDMMKLKQLEYENLLRTERQRINELNNKYESLKQTLTSNYKTNLEIKTKVNELNNTSSQNSNEIKNIISRQNNYDTEITKIKKSQNELFTKTSRLLTDSNLNNHMSNKNSNIINNDNSNNVSRNIQHYDQSLSKHSSDNKQQINNKKLKLSQIDGFYTNNNDKGDYSTIKAKEDISNNISNNELEIKQVNDYSDTNIINSRLRSKSSNNKFKSKLFKDAEKLSSIASITQDNNNDNNSIIKYYNNISDSNIKSNEEKREFKNSNNIYNNYNTGLIHNLGASTSSNNLFYESNCNFDENADKVIRSKSSVNRIKSTNNNININEDRKNDANNENYNTDTSRTANNKIDYYINKLEKEIETKVLSKTAKNNNTNNNLTCNVNNNNTSNNNTFKNFKNNSTSKSQNKSNIKDLNNYSTNQLIEFYSKKFSEIEYLLKSNEQALEVLVDTKIEKQKDHYNKKFEETLDLMSELTKNIENNEFKIIETKESNRVIQNTITEMNEVILALSGNNDLIQFLNQEVYFLKDHMSCVVNVLDNQFNNMISEYISNNNENHVNNNKETSTNEIQDNNENDIENLNQNYKEDEINVIDNNNNMSNTMYKRNNSNAPNINSLGEYTESSNISRHNYYINNNNSISNINKNNASINHNLINLSNIKNNMNKAELTNRTNNTNITNNSNNLKLQPNNSSSNINNFYNNNISSNKNNNTSNNKEVMDDSNQLLMNIRTSNYNNNVFKQNILNNKDSNSNYSNVSGISNNLYSNYNTSNNKPNKARTNNFNLKKSINKKNTNNNHIDSNLMNSNIDTNTKNSINNSSWLNSNNNNYNNNASNNPYLMESDNKLNLITYTKDSNQKINQIKDTMDKSNNTIIENRESVYSINNNNYNNNMTMSNKKSNAPNIMSNDMNKDDYDDDVNDVNDDDIDDDCNDKEDNESKITDNDNITRSDQNLDINRNLNNEYREVSLQEFRKNSNLDRDSKEKKIK